MGNTKLVSKLMSPLLVDPAVTIWIFLSMILSVSHIVVSHSVHLCTSFLKCDQRYMSNRPGLWIGYSQTLIFFFKNNVLDLIVFFGSWRCMTQFSSSFSGLRNKRLKIYIYISLVYGGTHGRLNHCKVPRCQLCILIPPLWDVLLKLRGFCPFDCY